MQQDFEIVDFDSAVLSHAEWKLKLQQYILGVGKLDHKIICKDNQCVLGKWIYGSGQRFNGSKLFEKLRLRHADFHQEAAKVVIAVNEGNKEVAQNLINDTSDYTQISKDVIKYLFTMKDEITNLTGKLINNVDVGFVLVNNEGKILPSFSKATCDIFGCQDNIAGVLITKLLKLDEKNAENFTQMLSQVFEDVLPEDMSLEQIPSVFSVDEKVVRIIPKAIRSSEGQLTEVLFTIYDITELREAEKRNREMAVLLNLARQRDAFCAFLSDAKTSLKNAIQAIEKGRSEIVRREVHTLKGNSSIFGLDEVASKIHGIEDKQYIDKSHIFDIEEALKDFVNRVEVITGKIFESEAEHTVFISSTTVNNLESALKSKSVEMMQNAIEGFLNEIDLKTAANLLGPLNEASEALSKKFDKKVSLEILGRETKFSKKRHSKFFGNFIHLLRNSIDHGIEAPYERENKPEIARIRIDINVNKIVFSDDGRGIDTGRLVQKAIEKGLINQEQSLRMSDQEKLELIFWDGLSTAASVSDTSGRGVGMSAVREAAKAAGWTLKIDSVPGQGTRFTFNLENPNS